MYLNNRNDEGLILSFDAFKKGKDISDYSFENFKNTQVYNVLIESLCRESIDNYFKTFFYLNSFPFVHYITFYEKEKSNFDKQKKNININYSNNKFYLKKYLQSKKIGYSEKIVFFKEFKKFIKTLVITKKFFNRFTARLRTNDEGKNKTEGYKIGVSFKEGIDLNKRSDIFWYNNKLFSTEDVLLYFEGNSYKYRYENRTKLYEKLKLLKLNYTDLSKFQYENGEIFFDNIIKKIKKVKNNNEEKFLKKISIKLVKNVKFWHNFFKKFNIKIHLDSEEMNLIKLEKHIALKLLNACSVGRVRSYISKGIYDFMGTLSTDVNFVNQKDSADRLLNHSCNKSNIVVVTGDTNNTFTEKNINELEIIKNKISSSKRNFVLLVLDSNYSENNTLEFDQLITTNYFEKFYENIIKFALENKDTFLIIKSKKGKEVLFKNKNLYKKLLELEKKNICHIVNDPFRKFPYLYGSISNFIVATSSALPSALIDCVSRGKKGIFCDYPNLKSKETDIYKFKDQLIVNNLNYLNKTIYQYKLNAPNTKIGDWSLIDGMIDNFNDDRGHIRASIFLKNLLDEFKKNLKSNKALNNTAAKHEQEYGRNNIFY